MPLTLDSPVRRSFRPDVSLDIGNGADIKRQARAEMARHGRHATGPDGLRELFQSFDTLPDPLRIQLRPEPKAGVGSI